MTPSNSFKWKSEESLLYPACAISVFLLTSTATSDSLRRSDFESSSIPKLEILPFPNINLSNERVEDEASEIRRVSVANFGKNSPVKQRKFFPNKAISIPNESSTWGQQEKFKSVNSGHERRIAENPAVVKCLLSPAQSEVRFFRCEMCNNAD